MTTSSLDLAADLDLALRAARAAGDAILPAFRSGQDVRYKGPEQPVTDSDLLADRVIREMVAAERPDDGWLSEETADSPERLGRRRVWLVDPIDGTNSFVAGYPEWSISVALAVDGRAVAGVVLNPVTGEAFHAVLGGGAFLNGAPIRVSAATHETPRSVVASRAEMRRGEFDTFVEPWTVNPLGSTAYKLAKVADGTADVFVSRGPKSEWDVAAGVLIVEEAGGRVTDAHGGAFAYNRPDPSVRGVVAANLALHPSVLSHVLSLHR